MDSSKLAVKFFADDSSTLTLEELVPVFHSWIQNQAVPGHQLIDVADYKHVTNGPGIMLIAHEGQFGYDLGEGKPGLLYSRMRALQGSFEKKLSDVAAVALTACSRIEQAVPGKIHFRTDRVLFRINDRLAAPNTPATFKLLESQLQAFFGKLLGGAVRMEHRTDAARPFEIVVQGQAAHRSPQCWHRSGNTYIAPRVAVELGAGFLHRRPREPGRASFNWVKRPRASSTATRVLKEAFLSTHGGDMPIIARDLQADAPNDDARTFRHPAGNPRLACGWRLARGICSIWGTSPKRVVQRVLLVSDAGIVAAGHVERAVRSLYRASVVVRLFDSVEENPTTVHVDRGLRAATDFKPDMIIGLGGGSSMDCAKGINFRFTNGGQMQDYWGINKAHAPMLPMIAIPTTAGTGSEAQSFALITDPQTHQKMACGDHRAMPRMAILDPELTATQPPSVAAATGIDAVAHAVETIATTKRTEVSRRVFPIGVGSARESYERAMRNPLDQQARRHAAGGTSVRRRH